MNKLRKIIREFVEEFLSEEYPSSFSFEEFNAIKSYNGKLKYANERLQKLGSGSARVVYKVDNEKVIKIAKNKKGIAQNSVEAEGYLQNYDIVAKVFETDYDDFWIEMEWAKKVTPTRFKQITGVEIKKLWDYLFYDKSNGNQKMGLTDEEIEKIRDNEFVNSLFELIHDYNMIYPGDFGRLSSYGEVMRDGEPKIVLVDFGLTSTVFYDYYDTRQKSRF
jgi:mRNA-degrading endonuclease RelE of RelBE toxin-antitoxin system